MISVFVANLAARTESTELVEFFAENGVTVHNARIVKARRYVHGWKKCKIS